MNAADLAALVDELSNDPLSRGYSGMTVEAVAVDINTKYRSANRSSMTGSEIWEATVGADFAALTAEKKGQWLAFCGIESVDPFGPASDFAIYIFGVGSATIQTLAALRNEPTSRAVELFGFAVTAGDVEIARAQ